MALVSTVFSLLVLGLLVGCGVASHFRGGIIQWKPVNNGQIRFSHRIAWRRTYHPNLNCTSSDIGTNKLFGTGDLVCASGCSGLVGNLTFFCTDFSVLEDWVSGERSFTYNIDPNLKTFEAIFSSCCWISTLVIGRGGSWNVKVKVDLTVRPDGKINSSPVTATRPIYRLQHGCRHVISIPVGDPDRDVVRCRWANGSLEECGGVCNGFPNATLDGERCTISYVATDALGWHAVTIQIEDFLNTSSQSPLSSVPVQFLVNVFNSTEPCDAKPILVPGETPPDGSCIPVEFGTTYTAGIVATSGGSSIIEFPTVSPFGLIVSGINQSVYDSSLYYVNVTWTPTLEQFGLNIFCFSATNSERVTSNQSCITLLGGVQGPRIIPSSITPIGIFSPSPATLWSVTFDQPVRRPDSSRFIEVYQADDDSLVHRIDVTSSDVTFPLPGSEERTVTFRFDYSFVTGTSYYLLFQGGVAVGDMFCNQESHRITNTAFWTFTVASIKLSPRYGNMLGGTAVIIDPGIPLRQTNQISCTFDGISVDGSMINNTLIRCVSPLLSRTGSVPFTLEVNGIQLGKSQFLSVSPERAHSVRFSGQEIFLSSNTMLSIKWSPEQLVPESLLSTNITVDISLYRQQYNIIERKFTWKVHSSLKENTPNDGEEVVKVPSSRLSCDYPIRSVKSFEVCPVAIKVSVSENSNLPTSVGIWTGIAFLKSGFTKGATLRQQCKVWSASERTSIAPRLRTLSPCPPNQLIANFDIEYEREDRSSIYHTSNDYEGTYMRFFHSNITVCYRQNDPGSSSGQQCCYENGILVKEGSAGGSVDSYSPKSYFNQHVIQDLVPYILCCKPGEKLSMCQSYYEARPSGSEENYKLPVPACVYGDPHIVTLDGHKYTFNGKGEFTLIETEDSTFTLQGRMEQILDPEGSLTPGTVFTAIVAKQINTDTSVQFEVEGSGLRALVDREVVAFDDVSVQEFDNVQLLDKGNNTILAIFSSGINIEIKTENGIISVMLVGLPSSMLSTTQGLMGTFNGILSDDLIPKGGSRSIPLDSSLEIIHNDFGITWIIDNEDDSLFTYGEGESWSTFYFPSFSPMFAPTFNDRVLEEKALMICGDDQFCLFDVAATKKIEIGMATMNGGQAFDDIVEKSLPIICEPPCENGVCMENNACSCNEGFEGDRCEKSIIEECEENICENNGTCLKQALTYSCECTPEFEGSLCESKVPPFSIELINSSPRVRGDSLYVDFVTSKPAIATCSLRLLGSGPPEERNCSGRVTYDNLSPGIYIFRIVSTTISSKERDVVRRKVHIGVCTLHLINEGVTVEGTSASIQFSGTGGIGYQCRLNIEDNFVSCRSPLRYENLAVGKYTLIVKPVGCNDEKLLIKFEIK